MKQIELFIREIDAQWKASDGVKLKLQIIGSSAVFLQTDYMRGTKDADVLETSGISSEQSEALLELAGKDTMMFRRHRLYIDIVSPNITLLPSPPKFHCLSEFQDLKNFEIEVLGLVDVAISKLKRFNTHDEDDVAYLARNGHLPHSTFVDRFLLMIHQKSMDARSAEFPQMVERLNKIERDYLQVTETEVQLPSLIDA